MITFMRVHRRSLQVGLLVVIAAFVASLFIFGSRGLDGGGGSNAVATVNGESIPADRYQRRYQEYVNAYTQMMRERFTPELAERLGLPQQVVDDLVQEALVVQRARAEGLAVSDEDLNAQIHAIGAFQEGGRFTLKRYEEVLRRIGHTTASFEEEMRRRLTRLRAETMVRAGIKVSDTEIEQAFVHMREEVRSAWALVELPPIEAALSVTDDELRAHLATHGNDFRQPERRRVQYVAVNPKDLTPKIGDAEVEKYYAEHAAEFETPRQVHGAHILVRVAETGGSEAEDRARAKVAEAIRRVKAGEDFAKLAREQSQDPGTAAKGGDLGFVGKGEVVPPFEQALFALKKGEVSPEPVRTPFGFHAIKAQDIREGGRKPLKDVAGPIRDKLQAEAADKAARARAGEIRAKLLGAADFAAEARKLGLSPVETTLARKPGIPGLTPPDPLEDAAFALAASGISTPVRTPAGYLVLKNVEALPAAVPPLAEIRDKVVAAVKRQKAERLALERAKQLVAAARDGDLAAAARKAGATTGETPRFSRTKPAERLPGDVMTAALQSPVGALSEPVKAQQGYYVVKVLERVPPDLGGLSAEREKVERELLARKQGQAWESWLAGTRAKAKIDVSSRFQARRG
ncbi:MAG: peptidyl-prolyl cis-trans isomerase [Candidatus Rokubacteria bacterium]|nr:peptidyl-prolyl cis-trans isomerase [Candidatus Rokubacteria bacterium]